MFDAEKLWRDFPKTLPEFEEAFPDDDACREFLIRIRWGDRPRCGRCGEKQMWGLKNGLFECSRCGYQTSVTAGTQLHGTRKPLKLWFRAMWEMVARRNGISAKDLQRILGLGSYETAWVWMHKLRRCMIRADREPLDGKVDIDDGYVGGKSHRRGRGTDKAAVVVAAEHHGRIRMEHSPDLNGKCISSFAQRNLSTTTHVITDGFVIYGPGSLSPRTVEHQQQKALLRKGIDPMQRCHWPISLLKRWWIGTHHGAISNKHLQAYIDEHEFRYNRRMTHGPGRLVARLLQNLVSIPQLTMGQIVHGTPSLRFVQT